MSYSEFLKSQSKEFLNEALGKKDADLFNKGELKITKFKERQNAPMSLAELESSHDLSLTNPED